MKIAGIDCGVSGSTALWDTNSTDPPEFFDLPLNDIRELDTRRLFDKLLDWGPEAVCTEITFRQPKLQAMTGEVKAVAKILQADLLVASVSKWKRKVLGVCTGDKAVSIARCQELFPQVNLVKPRCRTDSADRAEAALLGYYYWITQAPRK